MTLRKLGIEGNFLNLRKDIYKRSGRSPGGGHGNLLQCSCLENPMDSGAQQATVHRVRVGHNWATKHNISSVQFSCSVVSNSVTPWTAACQASLSITNSRSLFRLMSIESVTPSSHLILCRPFSSHLQSLPASGSFPMSQLFTMRWPKYWSFSFSISPSNEHPGLISFRMDWLHLLAAQGALKSLLQHHSSKASILRRSAFFIAQLSGERNGKPLQYSCLENPMNSMKSTASVQFGSVAQSCPTLCNPMNRSTPGLPVHHQLPEFTQTHVCWVGDAI